ncbi:unnamed protein product [Moneuplotes crassus]|uniref:Uncharacterized protein n=1 Tax=Euplotes crassus TaxID=5936 RepID=A0AAD1UCS2_EUPCR|nr:unnamed protein product [Moneuplotes crassus]
MESLSQPEERCGSILGQEKLILGQSKEINEGIRKTFCDRLYSIQGGFNDSDSDIELLDLLTYKEFHFETERELNFMKKMDFFRLFHTNELSLSCMNQKKCILSFIKFLFPLKVNRFCLSNGSFQLKSIAVYLNKITRISSRVLEEISFRRFNINHQQLRKILVAFKLTKELKFIDCRISVLKILKFSDSLKNSEIMKLDFSQCGTLIRRDWNDYPLIFLNLIQGLSTSLHLKLSLSEITVNSTGIQESNAREILDANGFTNVKLAI